MADPGGPARIAVVHEWLVDFAGSEQVLEQILALFPNAVLHVLIDRMAPPDRGRLRSTRTVTSWLDNLPFVQRYFMRCLPFMPMAVQQFDLSDYDLVISSNHCVAKGVLVPPNALHLCYCHSPMRYAWDMQTQTLRSEGLQRGPAAWLARLLMHRLRPWDAYTANGVDHFVANSKFVRQRILKAYRRTATVIHPPVEVTTDALVALPRGTAYLSLGRLVGYKNTSLIVEAFRLLPDRELIVAGTGPESARLRRRAPPNVRFTGSISASVKKELLQSARAFLFAAVEDFGITPVEALAAGMPVVALRRGGVLDYLVHGHNAWLYDQATPRSLADAIIASESGWPPDVAERCKSSAERFSAQRFRTQFGQWVQQRWTEWQAGDHSADRA